jgi:hypothetical protein
MAVIQLEVIFETDLPIGLLNLNGITELLSQHIGAEYFQSHVNEGLQNEYDINIQATDVSAAYAVFEVCPGWDSPCLKHNPKT